MTRGGRLQRSVRPIRGTGSGTSIDCRGKELDGGRRVGGGPRRATATRSPQARNEEEKGEKEKKKKKAPASSVCLLWLEDRGRREGGSESGQRDQRRRGRDGVQGCIERDSTRQRDRQIEEPRPHRSGRERTSRPTSSKDEPRHAIQLRIVQKPRLTRSKDLKGEKSLPPLLSTRSRAVACFAQALESCGLDVVRIGVDFR